MSLFRLINREIGKRRMKRLISVATERIYSKEIDLSADEEALRKLVRHLLATCGKVELHWMYIAIREAANRSERQVDGILLEIEEEEADLRDPNLYADSMKILELNARVSL